MSNQQFINSDDGILESALGYKQRDYHPMRIFEVYAVDGQWRGIEHEGRTPSDTIRGFSYAHDFRGKSAHIVIVSHDSRVSYDVALEFATAIAHGAYSYIRVDLSKLTGFYNRPKKAKKGSK